MTDQEKQALGVMSLQEALAIAQVCSSSSTAAYAAPVPVGSDWHAGRAPVACEERSCLARALAHALLCTIGHHRAP